MEVFLYLIILLFAFLGTPIFIVMALGTAVAFYFAQIDLSAMAIEIYRLASAPTILTIPLFTLAGYIMAQSNSPKRLVTLANASLGWLPGGVSVVSLIICAFFTAFTGASGVTIIALGGLLLPMLIQQGQTEKFSLGLITTSGSLGLLFAPSLPLILYGIVAKVSIEKLFIAGIIPGTLLIIVLSIYSIYKNDSKTRVQFNSKNLVEGIYQARYELPIPFIVLGGIYSGLITPTEASVLTVFYVILIECFLYRDLDLIKDIPSIAKESMSLVGAILIILCCALALTNYLVDEEIPMQMLAFIKEHVSNKYVFLILLNIFLLGVGAVMDIFSAIVVVVPLILPIAADFGIDPIHLAIIFLTNLEIGYITPPIGINLFISSFRFDRSVIELYKSTFPFLILLIFALLLITFIPELSLFLLG